MNCCQLDNLLSGFSAQVDARPDAAALVVGGQTLTYAQLGRAAGRLARAVRKYSSNERLAGLLASRSSTAYAGVLAILAAGRGYVPLHPKFPAARTRRMVQESGIDLIIADAEGCRRLAEVLDGLPRPITVLAPDLEAPGVMVAAQRLICAEELAQEHAELPATDPDARATAYLLFTSGSTGVPKGVPVSHANVCAYLAHMCPHLDAGPGHRFSQTFDLTFDLSVHDLFVCWWSGACLVSIPHDQLLAPARLIRAHALTHWFSVPSVIRFMARLGQLKPAALPSLQRSLFCGEAMTAQDAANWRHAAVHSRIENLYGPTEATIAITGYAWDDERSRAECHSGIVPIGRPFAGQRCAVVDGHGRPAGAGHSGELWLAGTQVTTGYLNAPQRTAEQFVRLPEQPGETWYRTGDRVVQDARGCLHFLGRVDHQVQVQGFRVELQEIEHVLRLACGGQAVAVPWPAGSCSAEALYAFVAPGATGAEQQLLEACRAQLPAYMIPKRVIELPALPLTPNGKIDRAALARHLEDTLSAGH